MLLLPFILIGLFVGVFGIVFGVQETFSKDAVWAFLILVFSAIISALLYVLAAGQIGFLFTTIFILIPIMRFGMEQKETQNRIVEDARKSLLNEPLFHRLFWGAKRLLLETEDSSRLGRFLRSPVTELPLAGRCLTAFIRFLARFETEEGKGPDATAVVLDATSIVVDFHKNPVVVNFYRFCGALLLVLAVFKSVYMLTGMDEKARMERAVQRAVSQEFLQAQVTGRALGEYLARTCPDRNALLIAEEPLPEMCGNRRAFIDTLTRGFQGKISIAAQVTPPSAPTLERTPPVSTTKDLRALPPPVAQARERVEQQKQKVAEKKLAADDLARYSAALFDRFLTENPSCDLVIVLCGLPSDFGKMGLWTQPEAKRPKLVLLNADLRGLAEPISKGFITAALLRNPNSKWEAPEDTEVPPEEVFNNHFYIVDPSNVGKMRDQYPELLRKKQ